LATRIPSLDGWRGISILLVLAGHLVNHRLLDGEPSSLASYLAILGVKVFFVISGFLITRLAMSEEASSGGFSALAFYRRRAYRIFPAFFVYLAAVFVLSELGAIQQAGLGIARAAAFTCNVQECGWFAGHTWSLAFEEQFYLVFPLLFAFAPKRWRGRLVVWLFAAVVLVPVATLMFPLAGFRSFVVHLSCISAGVMFAVHHEKLSALQNRRLLTAAALLCVLVCAVIASGKVVHTRYDYRNTFEALVLPLSLAWLVYVSTVATGFAARLLRFRPLEYVGRMSFSLYLWQQLFTGVVALGSLPLLLLVPAALLSYHFVEQPFIRLGRRTVSMPSIAPPGTTGRAA